MSLQNFSYFFFLLITICIYLRLPQKAQTPFLLLASIFFYGKNLAVSYQSTLSASGAASALFSCAVSVGLVVFLAVFVWWAALRLASHNKAIAALALEIAPEAAQNATAPHNPYILQQAHKARLLRRSVITMLAVLAIFKYYNLSPLPTLFDGSVLASLPFPLGISFFTFAAIAYLVDVARGDCKAEESLLHLSVFLFFFATVTSGPICRGAKLLPQLHAEHRFDATRTVNALRLFALGLFKKVAIADLLALLVTQVFDNIPSYGAPLLLLALICYTFQLYFDFAGYSDLARASGLFLGIELPENFKTPFFATNFSGFWARWHISLSSWLQDYLFMPLAWADVAKTPLIGKRLAQKWEHFPVELCVFLVFFCSGFWHGNTLPFVIWGLLQGVCRVGEELCHRKFGRPKRRGVPAHKLWGKRGVVFVLWSFGMLFFYMGSSGKGMADCAAFFAGLCGGWSPVRFASELNSAIAAGFYQHQLLQIAYLLFAVFTLGIGFYLDAQRFFHYKDKPSEQVLAAQKPAVKWALYYIIILCIFAGLIIQNGGFAGGSFAYAQY